MCDHDKKNPTSHSFDRRSILRNGLATAAGAYIALRSGDLFAGPAQDTAVKDPHFFLQIFIPGGMNASYLFDARPLTMTAEKLMVNYRGKDGILYTGSNGVNCLRTEIVDPLMPYRDSFSVINGVMMSSSFDGHEENESYFLTGQPLGGALFFDDFSPLQAAPINAIRLGAILGSDARNSCDGMLKLTDAVGFALTDAIRRAGDGVFSPTALERLNHRLKSNAGDRSSRAVSKAKMAEALTHVPDMKDRISKLVFPKPSADDMPGSGNPVAARPAREDIKTILNLFKGRLTNSAMYVFDGTPIDTHDGTAAKALEKELTRIFAEIGAALKLLRETPFDDKRSMFDMTTVMIGSEFSRTMRQSSNDFETSGTDHNPLTNSILIGGKGFKGGMVVGASDFATADEYKNAISAAHRSKDPSLTKIMGRPFDFSKQAFSSELPATFNPDHYLNIGSVINTLYDAMAVPNDKWRSFARGTPKHPILSILRT